MTRWNSRSPSCWTTSLLGCILATAATTVLVTTLAAAQTPTKPQQKSSSTAPSAKSKVAHVPSTLDGVYTEAQAKRGKDVYFGSCRSCHSAESHTGATFAQWWKGKQLSDLFVFIATKMPKNDPGSLAPEDAADVVAYLLKMNVMPVGKHDMPPDVDSLAKFRIDVKAAKTAKASAASGSTSTGKKP